MARAMACSIRMGGGRDCTPWISCAVVVRECLALRYNCSVSQGNPCLTKLTRRSTISPKWMGT